MDEINEQRKKRLKKYCPLFMKTINPVVILPYFVKMHQSTKEKILCITRNDGTERGALELHSLMPKADSDWFDYLMKALREEDYTELLKKLKDEDDDDDDDNEDDDDDNDDDTNQKRVSRYRRTVGTHSTDQNVSSPHQEMSQHTDESSIAAFGNCSNTNAPSVPGNTPDNRAQDSQLAASSNTKLSQTTPSMPQKTPDKKPSLHSSHHDLPGVQDSQLSASSNTQNFQHQMSDQHNRKHVPHQNVPSPEINTQCDHLSTTPVLHSSLDMIVSMPGVHSQTVYCYTPDNADAGPFQQSYGHQSKSYWIGDRHNSNVINVNDLMLGQVKQGVREAFNRRLDHQTYPSNNWKSLADELGFTVDEVDKIGNASQLYEKLKTSGMKLVELVGYLHAMRRLDLISEIGEYHDLGDLMMSSDQQIKRSTSDGRGISEAFEESSEINFVNTNLSTRDNSKHSVHTNTLARNISTSDATSNPNETRYVPFSNSDNITFSVRNNSDHTKPGVTGNAHQVNEKNPSAENNHYSDYSTSNPIKNNPVERNVDLGPPSRKVHSVGSEREPYFHSLHTLRSDNQPPCESRIDVSASYTPASAQEQETFDTDVVEYAEEQGEERDLVDMAEEPVQFQNPEEVFEGSSVDSPAPQVGRSAAQYIKNIAGAIFDAITY